MIADASNNAAFCAKLEAALLDDLKTTSIQGGQQPHQPRGAGC